MSLAEQKEELYKILKAADEKTTTKVIDFLQRLQQEEPEFSEEDIIEFKRRSADHSKNPEGSSPWQQSLDRLRNKIKQ